jgi:hypothetical protein
VPLHPRFPTSALLIALAAGLLSPAAAIDFPLKVSANRRYLVDRNGRPVLVQGEAAWLLVVGVTKLEAERYLAACGATPRNSAAATVSGWAPVPPTLGW